MHTLGPLNEREAKRRNVREPLDAHVRSFERADPKSESKSNSETLIKASDWIGTLKDLTCAPRGSIVFSFASLSPFPS